MLCIMYMWILVHTWCCYCFSVKSMNSGQISVWTIVLFPTRFIWHMWGVFIPLWYNHLCLTDIRRFSCGVVDVTHFAPQSIILFWNLKLPTYFHAPLIWQLMFSLFFFHIFRTLVIFPYLKNPGGYAYNVLNTWIG